MKGKFITFEGPEGCGKTTHSRLFCEYLKEKGYEVVHTREPGGTRIGDHIRALVLDPELTEMDAKTELLLMSASRAQHVAEKIRPALEEGKAVVCDRFTDATASYQGYGRGFDLALIAKLNGIATGGLRPDLTILLDFDVRKGLEETLALEKEDAGRGKGDRMEMAGVEFHEKVREGYLEIAEREPGRVRVVARKEKREETQRAVREAAQGVV